MVFVLSQFVAGNLNFQCVIYILCCYGRAHDKTHLRFAQSY